MRILFLIRLIFDFYSTMLIYSHQHESVIFPWIYSIFVSWYDYFAFPQNNFDCVLNSKKILFLTRQNYRNSEGSVDAVDSISDSIRSVIDSFEVNRSNYHGILPFEFCTKVSSISLLNSFFFLPNIFVFT